MINQSLRDYLWETYDELSFFDNPSFDNSIVGVSHDDRLIYDFQKMIEEFAKENGCDDEEAQEYIEYNTLRAIPYYELAPIVLVHREEEFVYDKDW